MEEIFTRQNYRTLHSDTRDNIIWSVILVFLWSYGIVLFVGITVFFRLKAVSSFYNVQFKKVS